MKYKIEKNTVQETLILPLYSRSCVPNCTRTFIGTKHRFGCSTRSTTTFQRQRKIPAA